MPEKLIRTTSELSNLPLETVIYNYSDVLQGDVTYFRKLSTIGNVFWYRCDKRGVTQGISERYPSHNIKLPAFQYELPKPRTLAEAEDVIQEVCEALRLTVEYVGVCTLPPVPGWSWYNVLKKYAPESLEPFEKQWTLFRATERDSYE